jgi:DNA-binding response OmpR family regulator
MKKTVWVVEDDLGIGEIISLLLQEEGYSVRLFENARSFLDAIGEPNPDLDILVLDIMLPDGNGVELCNIVRTNPSIGRVPIMMMSANRALSDISTLCSADDFIAKPFDIFDFVNKLGRLSA